MSSPFVAPGLRRPLPPGRHRIAREEVLASQRGRLLDACAQVVAEHGFAPATIGQIVAAAQVSRRTFYEHFSGKEECFLATYDAGAEILARVTGEAVSAAQGGWQVRLAAALQAYLDLLHRERAFTKTMVIEVLAAGPEAVARRRALQQRTAKVFQALREDGSQAAPLPEVAYRAVVGGISEVVADHVAQDRFDELPGLADALIAWALATLR